MYKVLYLETPSHKEHPHSIRVIGGFPGALRSGQRRAMYDGQQLQIENRNSSPDGTPMQKHSTRLNHAEKNFIRFLHLAIEDRAHVFMKVPVSDVLLCAGLNAYETGNDADKVFDFVLCDKRDFSVLCVIELDDRGYPQRRARSEHSYKGLCRQANIPLLEIPACCGYDVERLRQQIPLST